MGETAMKRIFYAIGFGLLCGIFAGIWTYFLLFLPLFILIAEGDPIDVYLGYYFFGPLIVVPFAIPVGVILALTLDSMEKIFLYVSVSALVIGVIG